ncbi:MAG: hypothetical protein LBG92_10225 [Prevotellaceae bacterium]|jgi:hypothetical protein|nr:hypothetical protein [Prevotellaceae bacterium]
MKDFNILEKFLDLEFPNNQFDKNEKEFLQRYSICKNESESNILKTFFTDFYNQYYKEEPVTTFYEKYSHVFEAKEKLQELFTKFNNNQDRKKGFDSFEIFLDWWCEYIKEYGHRCYYCGVEEKDSKSGAENKDYKNIGKKDSHKSGKLQIDRKDSQKGYGKDNCVLACVLCNNAKCELIEGEEYKIYFGEAMKKYWNFICEKKTQIE